MTTSYLLEQSICGPVVVCPFANAFDSDVVKEVDSVRCDKCFCRSMQYDF